MNDKYTANPLKLNLDRKFGMFLRRKLLTSLLISIGQPTTSFVLYVAHEVGAVPEFPCCIRDCCYTSYKLRRTIRTIGCRKQIFLLQFVFERVLREYSRIGNSLKYLLYVYEEAVLKDENHNYRYDSLECDPISSHRLMKILSKCLFKTRIFAYLMCPYNHTRHKETDDYRTSKVVDAKFAEQIRAFMNASHDSCLVVRGR
ncbi:hypothetical protein T265_03137 [Opisthorchis viverrini]|uniref:Uncharacterized protein n=1 Tax=Opisthorchis viverrini TaxID=6198 RepID=A0A074ZWV5_OPIVI|nr:hypothetical protein T265_03137 [Opisthorchis viverrini]KER30402.1 hypothetical protein T265_03137 [Opisthorchis viverrini]